MDRQRKFTEPVPVLKRHLGMRYKTAIAAAPRTPQLTVFFKGERVSF